MGGNRPAGMTFPAAGHGRCPGHGGKHDHGKLLLNGCGVKAGDGWRPRWPFTDYQPSLVRIATFLQQSATTARSSRAELWQDGDDLGMGSRCMLDGIEARTAEE